MLTLAPISFDKTTVAQQHSCTLGYTDVPWLQRHHLIYMGYVHCGGAFQMHTHTMVQVHVKLKHVPGNYS